MGVDFDENIADASGTTVRSWSMKVLRFPTLLVLSWIVMTTTLFAQDPFEHGLALARGGEHAAALEILLPLAEDGHALAQYAVAEMYSLGIGVPADQVIAFKWMEMAAAQDLVEAQLAVAEGYLRGIGVAQDVTEGLRWMRIVADKGIPRAQFMIGLSYEEGWHSVEQDDYQAARWYRLAAEQGYDSAQLNLSNLYRDGRGVPHDPEQAAYWLRRAQRQE